MCHHMDGAYNEWYEQMRAGRDEESAVTEREEPAEVDLEESGIEEPEIEEPEIEEPRLEADD